MHVGVDRYTIFTHSHNNLFMQTFTRTLLFVLVAFGLSSAMQAQESIAPKQLSNEQSTSAELRTPPAPQASLMMADTFYYEDFGDGIADWTFINTNPDSVQIWEYETNPDLSADNGDTRYQTLASPSVGNGFLWFDYRKYIQDAGIMIGQPPYPQLVGTAISPYLDWSGFDQNGKYALNFYSYQPTLNITNCRVDIRRPGLPDATVWSAFQDVARPDVAPQLSPLGAIPADFIGRDSVQIVIVHDGDFYGWALDDILVTALPPIEVQTNDFIAIAPNFETPTAFAAGTAMSFVADIQNNGAETLDLKLAITIADSNSAVVYTDTLLYEGIPTDSLAENMAFPMTAPVPTEIGAYTGTYELFTDRIDEDVDLTNNAQSFSFFVTENSFSKGNTGVRTVDCCADDQDFSSGNIYNVPDIAAGDSLFIDDITFAISYSGFTDDDEGIVEVKTYGFRGDLNQDTAPNYGDITDPDAELVELSFSFFTIDTTSLSLPSDAFITVPANEDGSSVYVPSEFSAFAVQVDYFVSNDAGADNNFSIYGPDLSYSGASLAADSTGNPSISQLLVVPGRSIDTYGYFTGVSPTIDASVRINTVVSVETTLLQTDQFDVRPNPATTQFAIDFDFGTSVNAQFEIINAVGQTVSAFNRDGLSSGAITVPTQGMNNGLYYVKVRTDDGQTATRKLMVNR